VRSGRIAWNEVKTHIWAHNWDLIQTGHLQDLRDRESILVPGVRKTGVSMGVSFSLSTRSFGDKKPKSCSNSPFRKVITKPVGNIPPRASESAPSNNKSSLIRTPSTHSIVRTGRHLRSVSVVRIVLSPATGVHEISVSSTIRKSRASAILDHIRRTNEFAVGQTSAFVLGTARAGLAAVLPATAGFTTTTLAPVVFVGVPSACTAAAAALVHGALGHGDFAFAWVARVVGCEVWLQTGGEAWDGSVWAVSDWRCLWRVAICFGEGFGRCVVAGVRAVVEVCGLWRRC